MPRALRIEYEGAVYHVMNRGDRREPIVLGDEDRRLFLDTLCEVCAKTGWRVHALCLLDNHFHLVMDTPRANLVSGMKWFLGTYTVRFNRRHGLLGHLFSGRYKAVLVDGGTPGYFQTACNYVHLNPVRTRQWKPGTPLLSYVWSSYPQYLAAPERRWPWLCVDRLLGELDLDDSVRGRRAFLAYMKARQAEEDQNDETWRPLRRGWFLGSEAVRQSLLERVATSATNQHSGSERRESEVARAERLLDEELQRLGWTAHDLEKRRKGDPGKVQIARRLRHETTVSLSWIASRLQMGAWTHVSNLLRGCH